MAETTKADLEKEIHSLKVKLGKAEAKIADLEEQLKAAGLVGDAGRVSGRVFGPDAVPLEQR